MRILLLLLALNLPAYAQWWSVQNSGLDTNLRGVSVVYQANKDGPGQYVIWACGSNGVILRSIDSGKTWRKLRVAGADNLDFRGIQGFGAELAYVISSGNGDQSRIYKTSDGGKTWQLQYSNNRPGFFLDALACESKRNCSALSDPVEGKFLILNTGDGEHWQELPRAGMPAALPGEGAFAAGNSALVRCSGRRIYFGTGGAATARIFISHDEGRSWRAVATPISAGASSGIFSVACPQLGHMVAAGGDYQRPGQARQAAIYSPDDGKSWHLAQQQPGGYRSAVGSYRPGRLAAVGPNGTDLSLDYGIHWKPIDHLSLNALSFAGSEGWAVGEKGTVARFNNHISGSR